MKKLYTLLLLFLFVVLYSFCTKENTEFSKSKTFLEQPDTLQVNYAEYKDLLTILTILPDGYGMNHFQWPLKDRIEMVKSIQKNNCIIDTIGYYKTMKPHIMRVTTKRGNWTLAIYKFAENNYFFATKEIQGDSVKVQTFVYVNNQFKPTKMVNFFQDRLSELDIVSPDICSEVIRTNSIKYSYDFQEKDIVKVYSNTLKKEEASSEMKGNTIHFKVNKEKGFFDVDTIYWSSNK